MALSKGGRMPQERDEAHAAAETVVDYLWREQRTFAEVPLCPVDSLVFSALAYLQFDLVAENLLGDARVLLHDVVALSDWSRICSHSWMKNSEHTDSFMRAVMASRRWRDVRVSFYQDEFSQVTNKQFEAVTFIYPDRDGMQAYLAFRGTDGTVAGWREDFNLSYMQVIPSHRTALAYVSGVASALDASLVLGGHSKGGNLAEFAALCCDEITFARIVGVYNHDGPSFLTPPSSRIDDPRYRDIHLKVIPESSMIGMILETGGQYQVVRSTASGLRQHDPFTWLVEGRGFSTKPQLNAGAKFMSRAINTWTLQHTPAERERYVSTVFKVLDATDAMRFAEIKENPLPMLLRVVADSNAIDEDDRRFVLETTKGLVDQMRGQVKQDMQAQRQAFNPLKLLEQLDLPPLRGILKRDDEDAPPG